MGRTQINIKVSPDQKQEWENAVEDHPEVNSLSHLIRLSVTREIRAEQQHAAGAPEDTEPVPEVSVPAEVSESLIRIENGVKKLSNNLKEMHADLKDDDEVWDVMHEIERTLPAKDAASDLAADDPRVTTDELLVRTGASREQVVRALEKLKERGMVWSDEDPETGETVYFHVADRPRPER